MVLITFLDIVIMITIKCCLVAIQTGQYSKLVFEDLNRDPCDDLKYVTVVMLPNWDYKDTLKIGDIGYLQFESVEAGKTQWYDREIQDFAVYKFNANYFINFIKHEEINNMKEFKFD